MRLLLLTCAETCVLDQLTNRASLFNLLEEIVTPTFPVALYSAAIFSLWERDESEPDAEARLTVKLNTHELMQAPMALAFQGKLRCRVLLTVHGLVVSEPGNLVFEVASGGSVVGTWTALIQSVSQAGQAAA
jgi:hypothetical protein